MLELWTGEEEEVYEDAWYLGAENVKQISIVTQKVKSKEENTISLLIDVR